MEQRTKEEYFVKNCFLLDSLAKLKEVQQKIIDKIKKVI